MKKCSKCGCDLLGLGQKSADGKYVLVGDQGYVRFDNVAYNFTSTLIDATKFRSRADAEGKRGLVTEKVRIATIQ